MSINEMELSISHRLFSVSNRVLGVIGMICAPMLLVEMLLRAFSAQPEINEQLVGAVEVPYIAGWIAGAIAVRRRRVTGTGLPSQILFVIQLTALLLALTFSFAALVGITWPPNNLFAIITDLAWPFSHLLMLVVGIFIWRAGVWRGLPNLAPFLIGLPLLLFFAAGALLGMVLCGLIFGLGTTAGLGIIGYTVFKSSQDK